ncbi:sigma54 specific transcriptional regulator with PAS sensor, Fis family [Thioalkalivibrio nitratireducens DSM 14787]|uniref:Sigma54 specific transcriptional regulator with PAS sensor, Fis family n=1 Tax=Thioalkalivibrio nitratireducens (strain DSM 14787 / UNIQEM 213 / ALEN2) TaxID=1255043 RepID=L0E012_THIND|nr:sigma54 specific transcriptional regulator with PAS sensor, Fis family [Thioalkalivibrio nitratireducens DSM 14787]
MSTDPYLALIQGFVEQFRDASLVIDELGRIVTHNRALAELLGQPADSKFDSTLRLGPVNLQQLLIRAAIDAGEHDAAGRPSSRALDFHADLVVRERPVRARIVTANLADPQRQRQLRLVRLQVVSAGDPEAPPGGYAPDSVLESSDPDTRAALDLARRAAGAGRPLLILGESGTGKTALARELHRIGPRRHARLEELHGATIADAGLVSELFGHVQGAYPGADAERIGRLEYAHGGTLLLDEVAAMSPRLQAALLRVLDTGRFERAGENRIRRAEFHLIATSSADLSAGSRSGPAFRTDLYHRLAGITIRLPPLRERLADLASCLDRWSSHHGLKPDPALRERLAQHHWPGNFRELGHVLEWLRLQADSSGHIASHALAGVLPSIDAPAATPDAGEATEGLSFSAKERKEREMLEAALTAHNGNRTLAARSLGIDRTTLWRKLHRLRLIPEATRKPLEKQTTTL